MRTEPTLEAKANSEGRFTVSIVWASHSYTIWSEPTPAFKELTDITVWGLEHFAARVRDLLEDGALIQYDEDY